MMMTVVVNFIVSARVGQVTFLSSAPTSDKNVAGKVLGKLGTFGLSMVST